MRIGQGFDAHRLVAGRPLVLAGVAIPHDRGLEGHSDGDVVLHAVASALFGALGEGDLGRHFPPSDESLKGLDSRRIVERAMRIVVERGYRVGNLDCTVIAQEPGLAPHQAAMTESVAGLLDAELGRVNLQVTSTDRLGTIGRGEGIAGLAVVLLEPDEGSGRD
ncbi:MAG: 2-C-methyl-D-erythritol 2,4-cyclodiphosphate synthase [Deltaproteobacteria bacterium]|nr:2-C-methyl-D-erythritol 2,4-cyclodiphosphate synthase [Deltaproteobacteria bacterium]